MPKRNTSLIQTPGKQISVTQDSAYLILIDQLKAIELEAEQVRLQAMALQRRIKNDKEEELVGYTSEIEIMTIDLSDRANRAGILHRTIVQLDKNKEEV